MERDIRHERSGHVPMYSIVIPCRDDPGGLAQALRSVLDQSVADIEVIVVDDGSAPPVEPPDDHRVTLVRHDVAKGPAAARNSGLRLARGEIVGFCDSDDMFEPGRLAAACELHRCVDVAVVGQAWIDDRTRVAGVPSSLRAVLDGFTPHLGATTIRRCVCPQFDEDYLACEDVEWWIRVVSAGSTFASRSAVGYRVGRDDHERILNSHGARLEFSYRLLDHHRGFYARRPAARAFRWKRIAVMERERGEHAAARAAIRRSLRNAATRSAGREAARIGGASLRSVASSRPRPLARSMTVSPIRRTVRRRRRDDIAVLAFHSVPSARRLDAVLDTVGRLGTFISPAVFRAGLDGGPLPVHPILVTFDDGDKSILEHAAPVLVDREIEALVFVVAGLVGTDMPFWWQEVHALAGPDEVRRLKLVADCERRRTIERLRTDRAPVRSTQLTATDLHALERSGCEIGHHSYDHPCLDRCTDVEVEHQIRLGHESLTALGLSPSAFAYPNGNLDERAEPALRDLGYDLGFLFDHHHARPDQPRLRLSRLRIDATASPERAALIVSGAHGSIMRARGRG